MKIHEYNEMMAYLTRPAMSYGGRIGFYEGGDYNRSKMKKLADAYARWKHGTKLSDLPNSKRFEMEDLAIKELKKDMENKADGGRIGFELGGNAELKKYLSTFEKGATIDTDVLAKKIAEIYDLKETPAKKLGDLKFTDWFKEATKDLNIEYSLRGKGYGNTLYKENADFRKFVTDKGIKWENISSEDRQIKRSLGEEFELDQKRQKVVPKEKYIRANDLAGEIGMNPGTLKATRTKTHYADFKKEFNKYFKPKKFNNELYYERILPEKMDEWKKWHQDYKIRKQVSPERKQETDYRAKQKRKLREKVKQGWTRLGSQVKGQFHHMLPIGGEAKLDMQDVARITKEMNSNLAPHNKKLNNLADELLELDFNSVVGDERTKLYNRVDEINEEARKIIEGAENKLPKKYKGLTGWHRATPILDENGNFMRFDYQKELADPKKSIGYKTKDTRLIETVPRKEVQSAINKAKVLSNFWCGKKQIVKKAGGGRIGFSGSCPVEVKQKNFLRMTNDVANGKITGEAAEQIAKNAGKVVAKAGSKSALATIFGPAGIGIDIAYEVGSIGIDVAGGKSWNRALQDNWLTGAFKYGTGQEEFHKELYAKDSKAKPYGQALDLIDAYNKAQKNIDRIKQGTYRSQLQKEEAIRVAERDLRGIEAQYNALTKHGKIMEEGSNEYENYMAAKTEFEDTAKAKSYAAETSLKYQLDTPESSRFTPSDKSTGMKIDFELPPNYTTFKPDLPPQLGGTLPTKTEVAEYFKEAGYDISPQQAGEIRTNEKWRQLFEQPGIRGTQDWRGATGGIASLKKKW